ncbi:membrane protein [Agaricicola taiwanensis]|uniref:Membrane protein n=2 Tax=Agaricicola taiwanensis TaxID=591372 RepID=A0A8J2VNL5_9RHOB|nr:membrane protein [Agaricicola taiwanensis]
MLIRGGLLQIVTLGIYRFWYTTNIRKFLWGRTSVKGDALEYTGTGKELFIGFLIAMAVLLPLYLAIAVLPIILESPFIYVVFLPATAFLGQYAVYRSRRYRLTRTAWRGLRFHQTGSAWRYAVLSSGWTIAVILSVGLLYPFARASLERFKVNNTWYGNRQATFSGTGRSFYAQTWQFWLIVIGPAAAIARYSYYSNSWMMTFHEPKEIFISIFIIFDNAVTWLLIAGFLLLPWFWAASFRWWADNIRFGDARAHSELPGDAFYGPYVLYGLSLVGLGILVGLPIGVFTFLESEALTAIATGVGYIIYFVGLGVLYQLLVARAVWQRQWESLNIEGLEDLNSVRALGEQATAFGEGLLDALDVGGI